MALQYACLQDLALKALDQAKNIYDEMDANVNKIKAEHAEQEKYWQTIEARHAEIMGVL